MGRFVSDLDTQIVCFLMLRLILSIAAPHPYEDVDVNEDGAELTSEQNKFQSKQNLLCLSPYL